MAKRQLKQNGHQQQLVVILMTTCLIVVALLMKLDSVSATSISLNGNGNLLQQQRQQQQQPQPQADDNDGDHNYSMDQQQQQQKSTTTHSSSMEILNDQGEDNLKSNSVAADLASNQFGPPFLPLTLVKRSSGGFIGMRGKKEFNEEEDNENNDNSITFPWEQIQNSDEDQLNWDEYAKPNGRRYKKAPTAFYGVRGKKYASINGGNPSNNNQRWQDLLQKIEEDRTRDILLQDFFERLTGPNDLAGEMAKRAPTGFTGMRGKRPSSSLEEGSLSSMDSMAKRGLGTNAFVGVRGKKDVSHQTFKRSPNSESSAVGGGKRQRFTDFGNKFVAVRGKKNSYELNDNMATLYNNNNMLPSSAAVRLLYANSDKRTPSGFLGMRGKRTFTSDEV